jgi:Mor family transcriptional regulator
VSGYIFTIEQCRKIRKQYESGKNTYKLAAEYGCRPNIINGAVRRAGGQLRSISECQRKFTLEQCRRIREQYESGKNTLELAKLYRCAGLTIARAVRRAGGIVRTRGETARKYFRNRKREQTLFSRYELTAANMDYLYRIQKGLCLWCRAPLPEDSLKCFVDHIGGKVTLHNCSKIRGLCCADGACNTLAGRIEKNGFVKKDWGLAAPLVKHIKHVIKTNKGNIEFPKAA